MAESAADFRELAAAAADRGRAAGLIGGRRGRREEAHEEGELVDGARRRDRIPRGGVGDAVRLGGSLAVRVLLALGLEQLVGDAHLDVVGLAGEEQQRLVLRLPAET